MRINFAHGRTLPESLIVFDIHQPETVHYTSETWKAASLEKIAAICLGVQLHLLGVTRPSGLFSQQDGAGGAQEKWRSGGAAATGRGRGWGREENW